jgi:hypothetical protein
LEGRENFGITERTKSCQNVGNHQPVRRRRRLMAGRGVYQNACQDFRHLQLENKTDMMVFTAFYSSSETDFHSGAHQLQLHGLINTTPRKIPADSGGKLSCRALSK